MTNDDKERHILEIDQHLHILRDEFDGMKSDDDFELMFSLIHRPGFTTPRELMFVKALIDASRQAVEHTSKLRRALIEGIVAIGQDD